MISIFAKFNLKSRDFLRNYNKLLLMVLALVQCLRNIRYNRASQTHPGDLLHFRVDLGSIKARKLQSETVSPPEACVLPTSLSCRNSQTVIPMHHDTQFGNHGTPSDAGGAQACPGSNLLVMCSFYCAASLGIHVHQVRNHFNKTRSCCCFLVLKCVILV